MNYRRFFSALALQFVFLFFSNTSFAQVSVTNIITTFGSKDRPVQNVTVTNSSKSSVYVAVQTEAMLDYTKSPVVVGPTDDILVSPKSFSIEGNGQRTVRLLLKKPAGEVERAYRVYFIPQSREPGDGGPTITKSEQGRTATIQVLTGVGMLVFVEPKQPTIKIVHERDVQAITFKNEGNLQVYFGEGRACPLGVPFPAIGSHSGDSKMGRDERHPDAVGCYSLPSQRLYAGSTFRVEVPITKSIRYLKQIGSDGEYEQFELQSGVK